MSFIEGIPVQEIRARTFGLSYPRGRRRNANAPTGAVYLAGYTVECYLKALLLANVVARVREELLGKFCGNIAHNIEWLGALYRRHVGRAIPKNVTRHLSRVASWSTDMRYQSGSLKRRDADAFFAAVIVITTWADGGM